MEALISGRSGLALVVDGDLLASIHADDPERMIPRSQAELHFLVGEARDFAVVENSSREGIVRRLINERDRETALQLTLILLDAELPDDVRREAARELEELVEDAGRVETLETVLYAAPLPEQADLLGALDLVHAESSSVRALLERLAADQSAITEVREAWDRIPRKTFGGDEQRWQSTVVGEGFFRKLALKRTQGKSANELFLEAAMSPSVRKMPNRRDVLRAWFDSFLDHPSRDRRRRRPQPERQPAVVREEEAVYGRSSHDKKKSFDHRKNLEIPTAENGSYTLEVIYDRQREVCTFRLSDDYHRLVAEPVASPRQQETSQDVVEHLLQRLNFIGQGGPLSDSETMRWLSSYGKRLWDKFIPEQLQRQFWEHQERIQRMLIISDEDLVPWELLYPHLRGNGHDAGFLVEQFPIGRWRSGPGPYSRLQLQRASFVAPTGSPPLAQDEVKAIRGLLDGIGAEAGRPISDLSELFELFKNGRFDLLHFAGHGSFDSGFPVASTMDADLQPFQPASLVNYEQRFSQSSPLVFLNTCRMDTGARNNRLSGWATAFLATGAGAFIGSLWEVRDTSGGAFAQAFYRALVSGDNLGDAMQIGRQAVRGRSEDPSWLAYVLYGDPAARLALR